MRMHDDEVDIDAALVRRLLAEQCPRWAALPVARVDSSGTDNAMFRIGPELVARLPRVAYAAEDVARDAALLPWLAPRLPFAVPTPQWQGRPGAGYPFAWSVGRWIDGVNPLAGEGRPGLAVAAAAAVRAIRALDPAGHRVSGRGVPLAGRDRPTRAALAKLDGQIDVAAATRAWEAALAAPMYTGPSVCVHADLTPGNLLMRQGHLHAVIDWSGFGVGDPAIDTQLAWNLLPPAERAAFRAAVDVDDATWARGRGWALSVSLIQLPYYRVTNVPLADLSRFVIAAVLADCG